MEKVTVPLLRKISKTQDSKFGIMTGMHVMQSKLLYVLNGLSRDFQKDSSQTHSLITPAISMCQDAAHLTPNSSGGEIPKLSSLRGLTQLP